MNKSKLLAASSVLALSSVVGTAAMAQSDVEQVVVSASRVTIAGYTQPTPVTTIAAAQLESAGFADVAQSIQQLPAVGIANAPNNGTTGIAGSSAGWVINLRNLGTLRTLTLIDGQRVVQNNLQTGGSDLSTVPSDLVQRIDIVTGGASAAWGSDAVAGVVNVILNKNFTGFKASLQGSDSADHNIPGYKATATWGTDLFSGRAHFEVSVSREDTPNGVLKNDAGMPEIDLVNNPAYVAGNGQAQYIHMDLPNSALITPGGLINTSAKGTTAAANALRGIQFTGPTATITPFNFGTIPLTPGNKQSVASAGGTPNPYRLDAWDYQLQADPYHSINIFTYGSYKLTNDIMASIQASYGDARVSGASGNGSQFYGSELIKSGNPFIPAAVQTSMTAGGITSFTMGTTLFCNLPTTQIGNLPDLDALGATCGEPAGFDEQQQIRAVFTLTGELGADWSWNAYYQHGQMHVQQKVFNDPSKSRVLLAFDAAVAPAGNTAGLPAGTIVCRDTLTNPTDGCFPIDAFGTGNVSQAARTYLDPTVVNHFSIAEDVAEASMQGKLPWGLEAGQIAVAFGAGYRKESGFTHPSSFAAANDLVNGSVGFLQGEYNVMEGFGELDIPVLKNDIVQSLDASAAGRMTSYSTSGLVETWKLGLTSQVDDNIRLRTSWSLDIRAPDIYELFNTPGGNSAPVSDPKTGAQVNVANLTGGNINLKPEVATTVSGGIVLTPTFVPGLSLSADWYSIAIKGAVYTLSTTFIVNQCTANLASQYCQYLTYGGAPNGQGGQLLSSANVTPQNAAENTTSGLDFQADYTIDLFDGNLAWHLVGNYTDETTLVVLGQANVDSAGSFGINSAVGGIPKFKATLSATYTEGPWSGTLQGRYFGAAVLDDSLDGKNASGNPFVDNNNVAAQAYLDVRGSYDWNDHLQFYGAMDNVTDVSPPLVSPFATALTAGTNTPNVSIYDALGRIYRIGVRYSY